MIRSNFKQLKIPIIVIVASFSGAAGRQNTFSVTLLAGKNNLEAGKTWVYSYDERGNIVSRETYNHTIGSLSSDYLLSVDTYTYFDQWDEAMWNDGLKSYNGSAAFTYDSIGNPLTYNNGSAYTFTWQNGRELASGTKGSTSFAYTYNADGLRTQKVVGGYVYTYYWQGSQLAAMTIGTSNSVGQILKFYYDSNGIPFALNYNGINYLYITNLQGDVIGIASNAGVEVTYTYDAWGKVVSTTTSGTPAAQNVFNANPLLYRGYIYDNETGFYYLQSRYYDPVVRRFINPDGELSGVGSVSGYNLYSYCFNNPVNMIDPSGNWPEWYDKLNNYVNEYIAQPVLDFFDSIKEFVIDIKEDIDNYDSNNQSADVVFESNYFSNYKGAFVIKTPFDASFSFGFIGLSTLQQDLDTLNHEYGHIIQMNDKGFGKYLTDVAIPSIMINILNRQNKLPYDYYTYPWEAEANKLGGSNLSQSDKPPLPEGVYPSYWDLFQLFFD